MRVALGHESRVVVVVAPKRPTLKRRLHKWGQIALVKPKKRVTAFITPKKKHQKTNAKTQSAKGSASIRLLRVRVIIVIIIIIIIIKRSGTADERDFLTG